MAASERFIVPIIVLLLQLTAYANAVDAHLEILPNGEIQTTPIGSSIVLTCKPKVENLTLVENMQWIDPHNNAIESFNFAGQKKSPMYTELHQDNSLALFFPSLQEEQAGKYTCRANCARSVTLNKSVTIDAIMEIAWDNAPPNQYPILGEDFAIQCRVRARPSPSIDWFYNGDLIETNDHYVIDKYSLTIKNAQESDDGVYTCRASVHATGELKERPIRVEVQTRPSIEKVQSPINVIEGGNASIACNAGGKPSPMFTWTKSLTRQNLSTVDRFGVNSVTGALTITNVNREDAGEYQCRAANTAGIANASIQVNVIVRPKITEFLNKTVVKGRSVDIMCKAFGRPAPEVNFRKHTAAKMYAIGAQPDDDRIVMTNKVDDVSGEAVGVLTIHDALTSDDGLYECVARNPGGAIYTNGHLNVEFPPSFRSMPNVTVWSWEERPVNLTCIAESIPNATIRWTIRWTLHGDQYQKIDDHMLIEQFGNGPTSTLRVIPVGEEYYTNYKCIAANTHGTREHVIELNEATKPEHLLNVKMNEITATTIRFDLMPPTRPNLPVRNITVQYKEERDIWMNARHTTWSVGSLYVIEGLKPATPYDFRFAATNDVGIGNWGNDHREVTLGRTVPNVPKIMMLSTREEYDVSAFNNQYELGWVAPSDNGEPIDTYRIKYCRTRRVAGDWKVLENTCQTMETKSQNRQWLKNLHADTFYTVELQAHNAMGYSKAGFSGFKTARKSGAVISAASDTFQMTTVATITTIVILFLAI